MSPKKLSEVQKDLKKQGWELNRQNGTSHAIYRCHADKHSICVPTHKEVSPGVQRDLLKYMKQCDC